jgi:hypothetical protein
MYSSGLHCTSTRTLGATVLFRNLSLFDSSPLCLCLCPCLGAECISHGIHTCHALTTTLPSTPKFLNIAVVRICAIFVSVQLVSVTGSIQDYFVLGKHVHHLQASRSSLDYQREVKCPQACWLQEVTRDHPCDFFG